MLERKKEKAEENMGIGELLKDGVILCQYVLCHFHARSSLLLLSLPLVVHFLLCHSPYACIFALLV